MVRSINFPDIVNRFASTISEHANNVVSRLAEVTETVTSEDLARISKVNLLDLDRIDARCFDFTRTIKTLVDDRHLDEGSKAIAWMFVHDIKNALTGSKGYSDFLSSGLYSDRNDMIGLYNRVFVDAHRLIRTIAELRTYTRTASNDGFKPEKTDFDFQWTLKAAMERFGWSGPEIQYKDMRGTILVNGVPYSTAEEREAVTAYGDPEMTSFVTSNLLGNAVKYQDPRKDGVHIRVAYKVNDDGNRVQVCVEDDGIGITKEHINRIFRPGYRVPNTNVEGNGWGLALVKTIVEAQGGYIGVESEPGHGSRFSYTVPLSRQQFLFGRPYPTRQSLNGGYISDLSIPTDSVSSQQRELFV